MFNVCIRKIKILTKSFLHTTNVSFEIKDYQKSCIFPALESSEKEKHYMAFNISQKIIFKNIKQMFILYVQVHYIFLCYVHLCFLGILHFVNMHRYTSDAIFSCDTKI
jgi:hypothetical protein